VSKYIIPPLERQMLPDTLRGKTVIDFGAKANERGTYRDEYINLHNVDEYCCVDITNEHGAHIVDLRSETVAKRIQEMTGHQSFDVLCNFGTSEHVSVQRTFYQCVHKLSHVGSHILHWTPMAEKMEWHGAQGSLWHCHKDFFDWLANRNGYEIVKRSFPRGEISAVLYKVVEKKRFDWHPDWDATFWKNPKFVDYNKIPGGATSTKSVYD